MNKFFQTRLLIAALFVGAAASPALAQNTPDSLTVAIYAPSATFRNSAARLAYIQGLAKAIEGKTGVKTEGKAFVRYRDMEKAKPDFAVVDGLCAATDQGGKVMATAVVDGATSLRWGLYGREAGTVGDLKGKRIAYVETGCRDRDFMENALMAGEVKLSYFGKAVTRPDVSGAIGAVKDYKEADAVFAPASQAKGLVRIFDSGDVPTPAFVSLNNDLSREVIDGVQSTVLGYGAGGGISGWRGAVSGAYTGLAGRLRPRVKRPVFAIPEVVRLNVSEMLIVPGMTFETVPTKQHFWEPK